MTWNYRVFKHEEPHPNKKMQDKHGNMIWYDIREVYYDDNDLMQATTVEPCKPHGETLEELEGDLKYMVEALDRQILSMDDIPEDGAESMGLTEEDRKNLTSMDDLKKELGLEDD